MPASPPKPDKAAGRSLGPLKPAPTDQAIISDASSFAQFFIREIVARVNRTYPGAVGFVDESMHANSFWIGKASISASGVQPSVVARSPGQMRHFEPLTSRLWRLTGHG